MREVTRNELVEVIRNVRTQTAVSFVATTAVSLKSVAKNAPYKGATKTNTIAGLLGFDYEVSVNNQLGREDKALDFEAQPRVNGLVHVSSCLLRNEAGTELYAWVKVQSSGSPVYHYNGNEISKDEIAPYLKPHSKPNTQAALSKEVVGRSFKISGIRSMKIGGEELVVVEHSSAPVAVAPVTEVIETV